MSSKRAFVLMAIVGAVGGCGAEPGGGGAPQAGSGAESVAAAPAALDGDTPVASIDATGAVTGINHAALRTDFPDGGRVAAFHVLRLPDGGYALSKMGHDLAGGCFTQTFRLVLNGWQLYVPGLEQASLCMSSSCPRVYQTPSGPEWDTASATDWKLGSCSQKNDMSSCYCTDSSSSCKQSVTSVSRTSVLQ
jgi:hypothetical protein